LMDRGYISLERIEQFQENNEFFVIRVRKS